MSISINSKQISFGIYLQKRDVKITCKLISDIRSFFPENSIAVFYSGVKSIEFIELQRVCRDLNALLIDSPAPQTIGVATNTLIKKLTTSWVAICDGDIVLPTKTLELLRNGIKDVPEDVKVIQGLNLPQENSNAWAKFDALNDTMAFIRDRSKETEWFSRSHITIPEKCLLSTLHGGILFFERKSFIYLKGYNENTMLVQRSFAAKLRSLKFSILFLKEIKYQHFQPTTLIKILRRKIMHAKGSALNRVEYPELYKDSFKIRLAMIKSAFFSPVDFIGIYGKIYFFTSMVTFTLALSYYLFKLKKEHKIR